MPAAGWCGGTFLKPKQGSDNHWYLPNVSSAASDLIFSAPLQAASSLCKQGIYLSAVLADSLEHFPMWVCYTWTCVWWPLAVAGWVSLLGRWVGGRHPRAWWSVGCQNCIPEGAILLCLQLLAAPSLGAGWSWSVALVSPGRFVSLTGNNLKV